MTRISIIVPVFDAEKYLPRCIDSILSQTFTDFELLLIDDGSNDSSGTICDEYNNKDKRISVCHIGNGGVSNARNIGIGLASGEYICFLDSDDYMKPDMLNTMLSNINKCKSDIVICGTEENDNHLWAPKKNVTYDSLSDFKKEFPELLMSEILSPVWNKIYKKSLIRNYFPTDISFGEDLFFNLDYLSNCNTISLITDCPHFHDKSNENSLVIKFDSKRLFDIEKTFNKVIEFIGSYDSQGLYNKYTRDLSVYINHIIQSNKISFKQKRNLLKEWRISSQIYRCRICQQDIPIKPKILLILCKLYIYTLPILFYELR